MIFNGIKWFSDLWISFSEKDHLKVYFVHFLQIYEYAFLGFTLSYWHALRNLSGSMFGISEG